MWEFHVIPYLMKKKTIQIKTTPNQNSNVKMRKSIAFLQKYIRNVCKCRRCAKFFIALTKRNIQTHYAKSKGIENKRLKQMK